MALWLIRAGSQGQHERKFLDEERVYLTWDELEDDLTKAKSREAVNEVMRRCLPDAGEGKLRNYVGQVWAFCTSIVLGDWFARAWGGFKATVNRELTQKYFKLRLWDQKDLTEQILANYPDLDAEVRAALPLKRIWTVAGADEDVG